MKKYIFIIVLFFTYKAQGQLYVKGEAHYKMEITGRVGASGSDCGNGIKGGLQYIAGIFEKRARTPHVFARGSARYPEVGIGLRNVNFANSVIFTEDNKIKSLHLKTVWRGTTAIGICKSSDYEERYVSISNYCTRQYYDFYGIGLNQPGNFTLNVYPEIKLSLQNNLFNVLGEDDWLIISDIKGINNDFYRWEYQISGGSWVSLPASYQNKNSLRIQGRDFLPSQAFNKNVLLRVNAGCKVSDYIAFTYQKSLPKIVSVEPKRTTCYDADDGQVKLLFDRALVSGEVLHFSVTQNGQPVSVGGSRNITQLEKGNTITLKNIAAGSYQLKMIGTYQGQAAYTAHAQTAISFDIEKNSPVDFSVSKRDVLCHNGQDGQMILTAQGGTGHSYAYELQNSGVWVPFSQNNTHTIRNLPYGQYIVNVRDSNGCVAKNQQIVSGKIMLTTPKNTSVSLSQPQKPLLITYTQSIPPTFHRATNGKIVAKIEGGTIFDNHTYEFDWKNSKNQTVGTTETTFTSGAFYITLKNIPADTYYLTIRDKNYANALDKKGCTEQSSAFTLSQPLPLKAEIELVRPISCHAKNAFGNEKDQNSDDQRDESQDGVLRIKASGGVPFSSGKPYIYTWKKQQKNGSWEVLSFQGDTATGLSDGHYAINIEDANGIILGEYNTATNRLNRPTDVLYYFAEPAELKLSFEKTDATCKGNDGSLRALVSGGVPPYRYSWSDGKNTAEIKNLLPLPYFLQVTDSRGCIVQGSITIEQPKTLEIKEKITPLYCHNAADAQIEVQLSGGTPPYTYQWSTGASTSRITGLPSGYYQLKVTDGQGCSYFKNFEIENPPLFTVDLGENRTLCNGQTLEFNVKIPDDKATYLWSGDNGFWATSAQVTLSKRGTYKVTITNKNGCTASDTITIEEASQAIAAEFLLTTQAYENQQIVLVNTSVPKGETTQWLLPTSNNIEIISQDENYITLKISKSGLYKIGIKQTQGDCYATYYKDIIVEPASGLFSEKNTNQEFVKEFWIAPNPNDGHFRAQVALEKASAVHFRLYNMAGELMFTQKETAKDLHHVDFQLKLAGGVYILVLETPFAQLSKKIIIQ